MLNLIRTGLGFLLCVSLTAVCSGEAFSQTKREATLMDSFFRSSFHALKTLDAAEFLRWYADDSTLNRIVLQTQHVDMDAAGSENYAGMLRAAMLKGFADYYLKADGAHFEWRNCELKQIKYELQNLGEREGRSPWISGHAFTAFALILDRHDQREYAVKVFCIVVAESLVLMAEPSAPMSAPKGLDAWIAEFRDQDLFNTGGFASAAFDTAADSTMMPTPDEVSPAPENYRGMLGLQKITFSLQRSPGKSLGLQYDDNGQVVQMMVEQPQLGPVLLLMAQDKASLWKLEQDGKQLKGRCIYFDARRDEIIDLRRTD